jgi:hypothetical protein
MKRLVLISVTLIALTGCADRTRTNCERTKNKALTSNVTIPNRQGGGRCA